MTRKEAQDYIKEHATEYFECDKRGKGYICPICGSGSGKHGTGITTRDNEHFTCWTGCFKNADIYDIVGQKENLTDFNAKFERACQLFGLTIDTANDNFSLQAKPKAKTQPVQENNEDYTEFCKEASKRIEETQYHRGISLETLKRFGVGYVPEWRHPKAPNAPETPRLIIPVGNGGYLARDTRKEIAEGQKQYSKQRAGKVVLFNTEALRQDSQPVWVVEGELDALSIIDVGGQAVALGSVSNVSKLLDVVRECCPKVKLILSLDNDKAGVDASEKLSEGLRRLNVPFCGNCKIPAPYKDANDYLMASREDFANWVKGVQSEILTETPPSTAECEAFERTAAAYALNDFIAVVKDNRERAAISTGFHNLDSLLDGGLWPGLYFIGAVTSAGKTALTLQIADYVAQCGYGVLFLSLEMARSELIARTLSRLTFMKSYEKYETTTYAKTTRGILRGNYMPKEQELIREAISDYSKFGQSIYILQGIGDLGTDVIRAKTEEHIKYKGKSPVIFVDYAQILSAPKVGHGLTDKQVVDMNVTELKRISRDYDTPVFSISSFNRDSYNAPVSLTSFKESGAIEYSSDVLIGLQYYGWDYQEGETDRDGTRTKRLRVLRNKNEAAAKALGSQDIQLKILKNRSGPRGKCRLDFFPAFNYFHESRDDKE